MHSTRQQILNALEARGAATVRELAEAVGVTPMSIRYHLRGLLEEGAVTGIGQARLARVGRPQQVYTLVPISASSAKLDWRMLLGGLLEEIQALPGGGDLRGLLLAVAEAQVAMELENLRDMPWERRVRETTAYLSRHGHLAGWERDGDTFLVHGYNCPYHPLAQDYPAFCQMDVALISGLLGGPVEQIAAIPHHHGRCTFRFTIGADAQSEGA